MEETKQIKQIKSFKDRSTWRKKGKVTNMQLFTREQLLDKISKFKTGNLMRDRAFISFLYLTGCRVSESLDVTPLQIEFKEHKEGIFIVIQNMQCLKRREDHKAWRDVAISSEKDSAFYNYIFTYINSIPQDERNKPLFDFTRHTGYHIVRKFDDRLFPHFFRHQRCSDLARMGFNPADLRQYIGWVNDSQASNYVHLNWRDSADKFMRDN
jgi:integrase